MSTNSANGSYEFNTTTGRWGWVPAPPTKAELEEKLKRTKESIRACKRRDQTASVLRLEAEVANLKKKIAAM